MVARVSLVDKEEKIIITTVIIDMMTANIKMQHAIIAVKKDILSQIVQL